MTNPESGQELITGIDITDTDFATELPIHSNQMIIGTLGQDDSKTKSTDFVEFLLKQITNQ
ncbi:hypothetical protein D3C75_434270 [compost metagenome]